MRKTKIGVVLALALSFVLALAVLPAAAKKGKPPGPPVTQLVDVTMALVGGAEGLTTACGDADGLTGSLLMQRDRGGLSDVEGVAPILELYMEKVLWDRLNPESKGTGFTGCHGGTVAGSPGTWDGALWITIDSQDAVTDLLWHFDYYVDGALSRNGKQYRETVREHFTLSGHDLSWKPGTSTVSGSFNVSHFLNDRESGESIGYVPFPGSPRELTFTLTFEPHS